MEIMLKPTTKEDILVYFAKLLAPKINLLAANSKRLSPKMKLATEPKMLIAPDFNYIFSCNLNITNINSSSY
jgi:hypothetical protein